MIKYLYLAAAALVGLVTTATGCDTPPKLSCGVQISIEQCRESCKPASMYSFESTAYKTACSCWSR